MASGMLKMHDNLDGCSADIDLVILQVKDDASNTVGNSCPQKVGYVAGHMVNEKWGCEGNTGQAWQTLLAPITYSMNAKHKNEVENKINDYLKSDLSFTDNGNLKCAYYKAFDIKYMAGYDSQVTCNAKGIANGNLTMSKVSEFSVSYCLGEVPESNVIYGIGIYSVKEALNGNDIICDCAPDLVVIENNNHLEI